MEALTLVANPGSSSRKYSLYRGGTCLAKVHFEHLRDKIVYSAEQDGKAGGSPTEANVTHLTFAGGKVFSIFSNLGVNKYQDRPCHGGFFGEGQIVMQRTCVRRRVRAHQHARLVEHECRGKSTRLPLHASKHRVRRCRDLSGKKRSLKRHGILEREVGVTVPAKQRSEV